MNEKKKDSELNGVHQDIYNHLSNLEMKAEFSRSAYLICKNKLENKSNKIICISIPITLILAGISIWFSNSSLSTNLLQGLTIFFSLIAIGISFFSLSDRIFGWNEKRISYNMGFKAWTTYIRESHTFRKVELKSLDSESAIKKMAIFIEKYSILTTTLPENDLTDLEFLQCKSSHLRKRYISKALDSNPCLDVEATYACEDLSFLEKTDEFTKYE